MGMINRVRARLQLLSFPGHKLCSTSHDDRHARNVCLLSAVLLVPYFARIPSPLLIGSVAIAYLLVVLPMLLSGRSLGKITEITECHLKLCKELCIRGVHTFRLILFRLWSLKHRIELNILRMGDLWLMLNQITFFALCDRIFCPGQRLTCLYSLMIYNVIAYCISYIKDSLRKQDWSPYVRISESTHVRHLAMSATKFVLELTKAVSFVITVVFTLLVFGFEQGLRYYRPTWPHMFTTGMYFLMTDKSVVRHMHAALESLKMESLEGMERLWAPVLIQGSLLFASAALTLPRIVDGDFRLAAFAGYTNVYLCWKGPLESAWKDLRSEFSRLSKYRKATEKEVCDRDDVCAVCLQPMKFARLTPCNHMFHGDCLRLCLREKNNCPMCKQEL